MQRHRHCLQTGMQKQQPMTSEAAAQVQLEGCTYTHTHTHTHAHTHTHTHTHRQFRLAVHQQQDHVQ